MQIIKEPTKKFIDNEKIEIKYGHGSRTGEGNLFLRKINQDNANIFTNKFNDNTEYLFVVADGHGFHGEKVASFIVKYIQNSIFSNVDSSKKISSELFKPNILKEIFKNGNKALEESTINASLR